MGSVFEIQGFGYASWWNGNFAQAASTNALGEIAGMQANAVAITASWYMANSTSSDIYADPLKTESFANVAKAIDDAHARGLSVLLKPHVDALDGKPRMQTAPTDPAAWFADYKAILLDNARLADAHGVASMSLGTELDGMTVAAYRHYWLDIIDSVRAVFSGTLTYGANWDGGSKVSFWDRLDYIGIDGYLPISNASQPTLADLVSGWITPRTDSYYRGIFQGLSPYDYYRSLAETTGKSFVFTEIGWRSMDGAAARPFDNTPNKPADPQEQSDLYQAFFQVFSQAGDWFRGAYVWHWSPLAVSPRADDFQSEGKPAEALIRAWFSGQGTIDLGASIITGQTLNGTLGDDVITGGLGDDVIDGRGAITGDALAGGAGDDVIFVRHAFDRVTEQAGQGIDTVVTDLAAYTLPAYVEKLIVTRAAGATGIGNWLDNTLTGNAGHDRLEGMGGADSLDGGGGNDTLLGGTGIDMLFGGAGDDLLDGGVETDSLDGGSGFDVAAFGSVAGVVRVDVIAPGHWRAALPSTKIQELYGIELVEAPGGIFAMGSAGDDQINSGGAADTLQGGAGHDYLAASGGNDSLDGGEGRDWLWAGPGDDTLDGGDGRDNLNGEAGNDLILGGGDNDRITGRDGNDTIHAGAGDDWVGVWNDFGEAPEHNYFPEWGDDQIDGGDGNDVLSAGFGNDTVDGGPGNDYVAGEQGDDSLSGGEGLDWLWGGDGRDSLHGGAGRDNLNGEAGDDLVFGGEGADRITGNAGNDTVHAGEGDDWVGVWNDWGEDPARNYFPEGGDDLIFGEGGDDVLSAGFGNDTVDGGSGNDYVAGEQGDDSLTGGEGIDWLWGGAGDDTLAGGLGADHLIGEGGADLFLFRSLSDCGDRILDFDAAEGDRIGVTALLASVGYAGADPFSDARLAWVAAGADIRLELDGGLVVVIASTGLFDLPAGGIFV